MRIFQNGKYSILRAALLPIGIIVSGVAVFAGSQASFSGTTEHSGSAWGAGAVSLDSGGPKGMSSITGSKLFNAHTITPGYSEERCVTVTSRSDIQTLIKMYSSAVSYTPLTEALTLNISKGTVDPAYFNSTSCQSFHDGNQIYDGTLAEFGRQDSNYSTGASSATGGDHLESGASTTYRITLGLPTSADNSVAGAEAGATFKWEAQSQ